MESGGGLAEATLPEVLKRPLSFKRRRAMMAFCAIDSPVHARRFEASSDRHFALQGENSHPVHPRTTLIGLDSVSMLFSDSTSR
jgi:hypothetical protein